MSWLITPLLAVLLDLWLKDPPSWPHPVRLLGWFLDHLERLARISRLPQRAAGLACMLIMVLGVSLTVGWLTALPVIGGMLALYLSFAGLALGGLLQEGRRVAHLLRAQDVEAARTALRGLVSRDVSQLDAEGLYRTLAETVSENLNDAFVAPFFYLVCLGPAGLWAYKTVSTMDSMWGYTTPRWRELGWAAAKADDVLAFLPARLTALALAIAARLLGLRTVHWSELRRTASLTESPNAGWPMAAAALALQAGMGGPARYFGQTKVKPWLGLAGEPWTAKKVDSLLQLVLIAGLGVCATFTLAVSIFVRLWALAPPFT